MGNDLFDVVVVGRGLAACAVAIGSVELGFSTAMVAPPTSGASDAVVAIVGSARDRLTDLGFWSEIERWAWPVGAVRVEDTETARQFLYRQVHGARGGLLSTLPYRALRDRFEKRARETAGLAWFETAGLRSVIDANETRLVRLADGRMLRAHLVVGADGRRSVLRECAGLTARRTDYPQTALAFLVDDTRMEADTAVERLGPGSLVSVLPVAPRRFAITWICESTSRHATCGGETKLGSAAVAQAIGRGDACAPTIVSEVVPQRLSLAHADRYVAPRLVLVGDAAHGGHPVPAQGANLAIGDVHELLTLWRASPATFASAQTLATYQRTRRLANAARLGVTDSLNRLFPGAQAPFAFAAARTPPRRSPSLPPTAPTKRVADQVAD